MNQKSKWMGRWCPVRATPRHPWTRTRSAKHNIFYLQNDYKLIMKQTEVVLQQLLSYGKKEQAYCPQSVSELQAELKPSDSLLYAFNKVSIDFQSWFASQPCKCVK